MPAPEPPLIPAGPSSPPRPAAFQTWQTPSLAVVISKRLVVALLASVYVLAFILSPYWILPQSLLTRAVILAALVLFGAVWSFASAGALRLEIRRSQLLYGGILILLLLLLNWRALTAVIPWRGDESKHISLTQELAFKVPALVFASIMVGLALVLFLVWRNWKWGMAAGVIAIGASVFLLARSPNFQAAEIPWILRYPMVNYWLYLVPVKLFSPFTGLFREILYRVVPFLALAGVAWAVERDVVDEAGIRALAWGLAVATIPLVLYYSSLLYIEQPAVLLMVFVSLRFHRLLKADPGGLRTEPAWYALILIGFIRDTVLLFPLFLFLCRLGYQARARTREPAHQAWKSLVRGELWTGFCVFAPYVLYMALRSQLANFIREYQPSIFALANPFVYRALGEAFVDQFGGWLLVFVAGLFLLLRRKDYWLAAFLLLVAVAYPFFFALDSQGIYAGYSRFNLLVLPAIMAGSIVAIRELNRHNANVGVLLACLLIATNLLLSPLHIDGTKAPLWGNYLYDTSDHYYPYRDALVWLKDNSGTRRILFTGMNFVYDFPFYFEQLKWKPQGRTQFVSYPSEPDDNFAMAFSGSAWRPQRVIDQERAAGRLPSESQQLAQMLVLAADGRFGVVVYQVMGTTMPERSDGSGFRLVKVLQNEAHTLLIYLRNP